jgi:hypothetical protein
LVLKIEGFFPNPASTTVNVVINTPDKDKITVFLMDITGRIVMQKEINVETGRNTVPVDISQLANTTYMLKVTAASGAHESFKVVMIK